MRNYLVANRGIIAASFIKTLNRMGKKSFFICSKEELDSYPAFTTDHLVLTDNSNTRYLEDEDLLIKIMIKNEIEGFIPGYGFKSQNSLFADKCRKNRIKFIGPAPEILEKASNKFIMKKISAENSVPIVKSSAEIRNYNEFENYVSKVSFPIILKPVNGWGSQNIKIIKSKKSLKEGYKSFMKKMQAFKGLYQKTFIVEEYLEDIREIELPYVIDFYDNIHLLNSVENTIQYQLKKVIPISPAPDITKQNLERMKDYAKKLLKSIGVKGVGVVEFFIDSKDNIYFNEINPTIPFNFPIIEEKNSISLTETIIKIFEEEEINILKPKDGFVLGLNLYAEEIEVRETKGILDYFEFSAERNSYLIPVYNKGEKISLLYDPLIGTLIISDDTINNIKKRGLSSLQTLILSGIGTNVNFLKKLLIDEKIFKDKLFISDIKELSEKEVGLLDKKKIAMTSALIFHYQNRGKSLSEYSNFIEENILDKISRKIFG